MVKIKDLIHMADIISRPDLSLKAKGLYSALLCHAEIGWEDLVNLSKDGEMSIKSAVRELEDQGIVEVSEDHASRLEKKIPEWAYRVFTEWSRHPQLISHRELTPKMWNKLKNSGLTEDNAIQAIQNYVYVLQNSDFFKWKWTFDEFFQRESGAQKFVHRDVVLKQYCQKKAREKKTFTPPRQTPLPENKEISELFAGKSV